jgi:small-conductance mechanosensitive channel
MMDNCNQDLLYFLLIKAIKITVILFFGFLAISLIRRLATRALKNRGTLHVQMIVDKIIWYGGILLLCMTVLNELGFHLSALLGAVGIVGVAIGFASQTSMSNVISGIFLLSENFLAINDEITCGSVQGVVQSIDLFSIKIRTNDGRFIRIPNERLIKETLINETYYPVRRVEITMAVAGTTDLDVLLRLIDDAIAHNSYITKEPRYTVTVQSLSTDATHLMIHVWSRYTDFKAMKNMLITTLKNTGEAHAIKTLYIMAK